MISQTYAIVIKAYGIRLNYVNTYLYIMTEEKNEILKEIKRSFRSMMNGVASHSMREKGVEYKINWGVNLVNLRALASKYDKDFELAIALWKENIRECKILATMLMPADKMDVEIADIWMEQVVSQEMAEMLALNLLQYVDYAPEIAYKWMASEKPLYQLCGFSIIGRLFSNGQEPNERGINEYVDHAITALQGTHVGVAHAAMNSLVRFADLGIVYERIAKHATKAVGLDIL